MLGPLKRRSKWATQEGTRLIIRAAGSLDPPDDEVVVLVVAGIGSNLWRRVPCEQTAAVREGEAAPSWAHLGLVRRKNDF